ncbi:hypothetical protein [Alteromonas lipotrueae]|uniref:hypothetical protein n=1 Tax=Alteromonas lipotrueae TaxID=2803814 RepID=UPI001C444087|nr:hypothetical protein [Alteromonas lipotrueae]
MKIINKILFAILFFFSNSTISDSYTKQGLVVKMTVGTSFARVRFDEMENYEECEKSDWYILEFNERQVLPMYSMLLTAKASGQNISFQLKGCKHGYAVINHVYN